jgi:hypothetical protein
MGVGCFDHRWQSQPLVRAWRFVWVPETAVFPAVIVRLRRHPGCWAPVVGAPGASAGEVPATGSHSAPREGQAAGCGFHRFCFNPDALQVAAQSHAACRAGRSIYRLLLFKEPVCDEQMGLFSSN